ncbi:T9SS type A sorting domain-containing protein [Chitinophagaceae bacterium MMS25-I14]
MLRSTYRVITLLALFLFPLQQRLFAQMYRRDSTFNSNGITVPPGFSAGGNFHQLRKILVQPDGKILLVGANNGESFIEITRLKTNGTPDSTFGQNGSYYGNASGGTSFFSNAALAPDGKIMLLSTEILTTGNYTFLYRINTNGTRDNTFGSGGQVALGNGPISSLGGIIFQPDGKIILGGSRNVNNQVNVYMVLRLNANGTADNTFGQNGKIENVYAQFATQTTNAGRLCLQPDGKIVMATPVLGTGGPTGMSVVRFKSNGVVDSSFAQNGCYTYTQIDSSDVLPAGITVDSSTGDIYTYGTVNVPASSYYYKTFIAKLTAAGAVATGFGNGGHIIPGMMLTQQLGTHIYPPAIFRQPDGNFIIAGTSDSSVTSHTRVFRITAGGQPDNTFCNAGVLDLPRNVRDMVMDGAIQTNGDILLGGFTYNKPIASSAIFSDTSYMYCFRITSRTAPSGVSNVAYAMGTVQIYPNPATSGRFHLKYEGIASNAALQLELSDITGRIAGTQSFKASNTSGEFDFVPVYPLPAGVYLLKVSSGQSSFPVIKLVVY